MPKVDGGELIARVMRENRVKYCFAINGGHLFPILGQLRNHDIKLIHMRHEQATAYAADAYARTTRAKSGVCMVTAGCGLTNAVTGLCVAGLTNSAVVCISGQHPNTEDHLGSFQEAYGSEVVDSFSKFTKRVTDWSTIQFDLRSGVSRGDLAAAGRRAVRDSAEHSLSPRRRRGAAQGRARVSRSTTSARRATRPRSIARSRCWWRPSVR